jgi:subtilisin family serine protease
MDQLALVRLSGLMGRTAGRAEVRVALLDGPVDMSHPDLDSAHWHPLGSSRGGEASESVQLHGTFVAGILAARRGSRAPAICPGCTILHWPLFGASEGLLEPATPAQLAEALHDALDARADVVNVSASMVGGTGTAARELVSALDRAAGQGTIVVVAAGDRGGATGSPLTQHPWVIPVVAYDVGGRPSTGSNSGISIGRRGVGGPGVGVTSLAPGGGVRALSGSSCAAPFVAGAAALLRSAFAGASASAIRAAVGDSVGRARSIVPALMNVELSYAQLAHDQRPMPVAS